LWVEHDTPHLLHRHGATTADSSARADTHARAHADTCTDADDADPSD
jgi:hypothetical protein